MKYLKETALASLVLAGLVGCGGDSGSSSSTTPITLSVSDAPIDDVKDVTVTFSKVALLPGQGGSPLVYDVYKTDENGNYVDKNGDPLPEGEDPIPLSVNLLDYQGSDALSLIKNEIIPVGSYKLCVFAHDGDHPTTPSYVIENDDTSHQLTVKGEGACPQVGKEGKTGVLYFNNSFNVNQQSNNFVVEFDLRRGLKNSSTFPDYTIQRTSVSLINTVETGNIEGTVATTTFEACNPANDNTFVQSVYLYEGDVIEAYMAPIGGSAEKKPITTAAVNQAQANYEFSLGFIDPGTYSLGYTCTAQHDSDEDNADPVADGFEIYAVQNSVQVVVGQDSQVSF